MARVVILAAAISGHTAARYLIKFLGSEHKPDWNWIPSNISVGVEEIKKEQVTFPLDPIYKKAGVEFVAD